MAAPKNDFTAIVALLFLPFAASAGIHGVLLTLFLLTPDTFEADDVKVFWTLAVFLWIVVVFIRWRILPAVRSGEMESGFGALVGGLFVGIFLCAMAFSPGFLLLYGDDSGGAPGPHWPFWILALGLLGAFVASQSLRQALWFRRTYQSAVNLPTAKLRSAAMGPVEVAGRVEPVDATVPLVWNNDPEKMCYQLRPFRLIDATGSVRVDPPENADPLNEDDLLWLHFRDQKPSLVAGDEVRVIGQYQNSGGEPVLTPWHAPGGRLPFAWSIFGQPTVFVVAACGEEAMGEQLRTKSRAWILLGSVWLYGAGVIMALGAAGLLDRDWLLRALGR